MIDYTKIANAIEYYHKAGYNEMDVPWIISREAINVTKPKNAIHFNTFLGELVCI